jgi:hypothetical protein
MVPLFLKILLASHLLRSRKGRRISKKGPWGRGIIPDTPAGSFGIGTGEKLHSIEGQEAFWQRMV